MSTKLFINAFCSLFSQNRGGYIILHKAAQWYTNPFWKGNNLVTVA